MNPKLLIVSTIHVCPRAGKRESIIKAAFFNPDGTLISSEGTYTPAVKEALETLRRKGILVFAATGRAPHEFDITGMIDGLTFDAIVGLNGQLCYRGGEGFGKVQPVLGGSDCLR
jgi:hydroxymethylpyrimidine pyrophosphatase-like HAD family hydrolase